MTEQFKQELHAQLANLLSQINHQSLHQISQHLETLWERVLVAELIEARHARKSEVFERVARAIENQPAEKMEPALPEPKPVATQPTPYPLNPEIKVVPVPEGPPMPVTHASPTERIEVAAQTNTPTAPVEAPQPAPPVDQKQAPSTAPKPAASIAEKAQQSQKQTSLHQRLAAKNLSFGLNDRIAYIKHLFDGSAEDFNRVVNQLNTFESFGEAEAFIAEMVKPDYNWAGKEQYEERFMAQVKVRFEA